MDVEQLGLSSDVAAGTGFELLFALAAASRAGDEADESVRPALAAVGDTAGESWLNLLGVALDAGAPFTSERLVRALDEIDGLELRRCLLGRYAWSWCTLAGIDDIEAAATGDRDAATRLLEHPRYYGGHAPAALATLLPLDAAETKRRILAAAEAAVALVATDAGTRLGEAGDETRAALDARPALGAIEEITGYRYVPELEAERVTLVPHLQPGPGLLLAQHRGARVIAYRVMPDRDTGASLLALGRALADPTRVEILTLVGRGVGRSSDLVAATGITRSTVHHHLALLRDAGLVALEGNARAYTYVARRDAAPEAAALLEDVVGKDH